MIISTFAGIPIAQNSAYIIGFAFSTFSVSLRNNRVYSKIRLSQNLSIALYVQNGKVPFEILPDMPHIICVKLRRF